MSLFEEKNTNRFFSGAFILLIGNLFVKVLGLSLKVPLRSIMGDEGMTFYNNAYDIYAFLFTISTTGLPIAVSKMISATRVNGTADEAKKISKAASLLFFIIGVIGMAIMLFGATLFSKLYKITYLEYSIIAVAPTVLFICLSSSLRGFFQGYQVMYTTAVSELIESLGKFALGIIFGTYAAAKGYPIYVISAYATLGITIGVAAGALYLWITKLFFRPYAYYENSIPENNTRPLKSIIKELLVFAIPISLSSSVSSLSALVDSVFLSRRIQAAGFTESQMLTMVGNYKTCALTIYNVPIAFIGPITASIIPVLSMAIASKDHDKQKKIFDGSILLVELLQIPCALGMSVLSVPLIRFFFGMNTGAEIAAPLLSINAFCLILSSMNSVTCTVLHTYNCTKEPLISFSVGAVVKMVLIYVLAGIPSVNVYAAPITSIVGVGTIVLCNLIFIRKKIGFYPNFSKAFIKPTVSAVICSGVAYLVYGLIENHMNFRLALVISVLAAIPVYLIMIFITRALSADDLRMLPKGEKIASFLSKKGIIKNNG